MRAEDPSKQRKSRSITRKRLSHQQAIRREERRRRRPLTAEEQQFVIDMNTIRNRLFDLGLEFVGSEEEY